MGCDAGIFAKNAKKFFWFDRAYNMKGWEYAATNDISSEEEGRADDIYERMYEPDSQNRHVPARQALFVAELSKKAWMRSEERHSHRIGWCEKVIEFIKKYPNDVFSIKSDYGSEWPECVDAYDEDTLGFIE